MSRKIALVAAGAAAFLAGRPAAAQLTVDANTLALWHLDEAPGAGVAVDSGSAHHDLALLREPADGSGGSELPVFVGTGCLGGALSFDSPGSDMGGYAYDAGPIALPGNAFSVELFLATTAHAYGELFLDGSIRLDLFMDPTGHVQFASGNGSSWSPYLVTTSAVNDGQWHYLAATYDGATLRLYVDGVEGDNAAYAGVVGSFVSYFAGGRPSNTFLTGVLDEIRVSNVARTANSIATTANTQVCPEPVTALADGAAALVLVAWTRRRRRAP